MNYVVPQRDVMPLDFFDRGSGKFIGGIIALRFIARYRCELISCLCIESFGASSHGKGYGNVMFDFCKILLFWRLDTFIETGVIFSSPNVSSLRSGLISWMRRMSHVRLCFSCIISSVTYTILRITASNGALSSFVRKTSARCWSVWIPRARVNVSIFMSRSRRMSHLHLSPSHRVIISESVSLRKMQCLRGSSEDACMARIIVHCCN